MGDDLLMLDHDPSGVDTRDASDDDQSWVNERHNDCINDSKQLFQTAEDHVPVFDELGENDSKQLSQSAEGHMPVFDELDENDLMRQLFTENPQELACYAKNHVPMYDYHDYGPDRLRKIQFTLAHSHRYARQGLDMLEHAVMLLTELQTSIKSDHVSKAQLEGIVQWAEQMGAYAEVLDDYCDDVHEFMLCLINFDLDGAMFARHELLDAVADQLLTVERQMRAQVMEELGNMKQRQLRYQESLKFLHPGFRNVEAEQQVNSSSAQSADDQVNVQGNSGETNAVLEQKLQN